MFPNITNNATEPGSGGSYSVPPNIQIGVTIFAVLIFIFALIGNIVVIYIVCTVNHMRSSTNTLIANMAVADLLMTIDIPYNFSTSIINGLEPSWAPFYASFSAQPKWDL